jgi:hypothetical protein
MEEIGRDSVVGGEAGGASGEGAAATDGGAAAGSP